MSGRVDIELIGDDTMASGDDGSDSWMISYLDVLTLIIAFFVLMLALSEPISEEEKGTSENPDQSGEVPERDEDIALLALEESGNRPAPPVESQDDDGDDRSSASQAAQNAATAVPALDSAMEQRMMESLGSLQREGVEVVAGTEGITVRLPEELLFNSGQAELKADGLLLLDDLENFLLLFEGQVSVEGHTDSFPIRNSRFQSNWGLSSARAISVVQFLAEGALPDDRLRAVGYAATRPLESNATVAGRAANRRVELVLREP